MEEMRNIVEAELSQTEALDCVWDKIPEDARNDLVNLVLLKMQWAYRRGQENR